MNTLVIRRRSGFSSWIRVASLGLMVVTGLMAGAPAIRAQEADLIDKFETTKSLVAKSVRTTGPEFLPRLSKSEQKIVDALGKTTEVAFRDNDLAGALSYLAELHQIEIWVDSVRVNPEDVTVTLESTTVSLRSCLNLILEPHGLCFLVEDDILKVTSTEVAESKFITRTYPVGDLFSTPEEAEELLQVLECGLGLRHGDEAPRSLAISTKSRALVVRQTHQVHDQLLQLLRDLRDDPADDSPQELVLNFGFERDRDGTNKSAVPLVFFNELYVEVSELTPALEQEKRGMTAKYGKDAVQNTTVVVRAGAEVPAKLVQQLIKKCQDSGFTKFTLRAMSKE